MELNKTVWEQKDIEEFQAYLLTLKNESKIEWSRNIIRTSLPMLAIPAKDIKEITKNIYKGNFLSYLDNTSFYYYENCIICSSLISKIKDFETQKKYLLKLCKHADCWATCDTLKFIIKNNEENYLKLSKELAKSKETFTRRISINILFSIQNTMDDLKEVFEIIDYFENEEEYYVNMMNAWLICECFIKHREETIKYLDRSKLNKFTINKAIQKCRDSYRITPEDKEMLLKYKK